MTLQLAFCREALKTTCAPVQAQCPRAPYENQYAISMAMDGTITTATNSRTPNEAAKARKGNSDDVDPCFGGKSERATHFGRTNISFPSPANNVGSATAVIASLPAQVTALSSSTEKFILPSRHGTREVTLFFFSHSDEANCGSSQNGSVDTTTFCAISVVKTSFIWETATQEMGSRCKAGNCLASLLFLDGRINAV
ncbi:hypothetical protein TcCL_ESM06898 [Trypanosoma cruzi]|nr:hypothetical protein TcCL_ESM06898 [Trypanosoma cruzi]